VQRRYCLPRRNRLQRRREFEAIRRHGRRVARGCLIANWMQLPPGTECRVGLIVNKKVGSAVVRSHVRRLLREVFRRHQHDFREPVAVVLVARPSIAGKSLGAVERDFLAVGQDQRLLASRP